MNFVGHHEVARRVGLGDAGRLGAMLPDFATMLGTRLKAEDLPAEVRVGVELHHRTDAVFHGLDAVLHGMREVTTTLLELGVGRGAARAVGHIGYEMLLDAALVAAPITTTLTARPAADRRVDEALGRAERWPAMRQLLAEREPHYDDPVWVAERLFEILQRRPRLAFPAEHLPSVASALAATIPGVSSSASGVLRDVIAAVDPAASGPDRPTFTLLG
jgi:hypothetical protein